MFVHTTAEDVLPEDAGQTSEKKKFHPFSRHYYFFGTMFFVHVLAIKNQDELHYFSPQFIQSPER